MRYPQKKRTVLEMAYSYLSCHAHPRESNRALTITRTYAPCPTRPCAIRKKHTRTGLFPNGHHFSLRCVISSSPPHSVRDQSISTIIAIIIIQLVFMLYPNITWLSTDALQQTCYPRFTTSLPQMLANACKCRHTWSRFAPFVPSLDAL